MSMTGRFNPDFRKESDLPNSQLPRDTLEEIAALEEREAEEEADGE